MLSSITKRQIQNRKEVITGTIWSKTFKKEIESIIILLQVKYIWKNLLRKSVNEKIK